MDSWERIIELGEELKERGKNLCGFMKELERLDLEKNDEDFERGYKVLFDYYATGKKLIEAYNSLEIDSKEIRAMIRKKESELGHIAEALVSLGGDLE